jgi:hypothetical protein
MKWATHILVQASHLMNYTDACFMNARFPNEARLDVSVFAVIITVDRMLAQALPGFEALTATVTFK